MAILTLQCIASAIRSVVNSKSILDRKLENELVDLKCLQKRLFARAQTYTHAYAHTHIYVYVCMCMYACICVKRPSLFGIHRKMSRMFIGEQRCKTRSHQA